MFFILILIFMNSFLFKKTIILLFLYIKIKRITRWPRGLMDIAPDYGSGDWGFESLRGRIFFFFKLNAIKYFFQNQFNKKEFGFVLIHYQIFFSFK